MQALFWARTYNWRFADWRDDNFAELANSHATCPLHHGPAPRNDADGYAADDDAPVPNPANHVCTSDSPSHGCAGSACHECRTSSSRRAAIDPLNTYLRTTSTISLLYHHIRMTSNRSHCHKDAEFNQWSVTFFFSGGVGFKRTRALRRTTSPPGPQPLQPLALALAVGEPGHSPQAHHPPSPHPQAPAPQAPPPAPSAAPCSGTREC